MSAALFTFLLLCGSALIAMFAIGHEFSNWEIIYLLQGIVMWLVLYRTAKRHNITIADDLRQAVSLQDILRAVMFPIVYCGVIVLICCGIVMTASNFGAEWTKTFINPLTHAGALSAQEKDYLELFTQLDGDCYCKYWF